MIKKKTRKRLMSLLTAFVMCSVVVPCAPKQTNVTAVGVVDGVNVSITNTVSASSYNPSASTAYAQKYCYNYNPEYSNYNSIGGDCANFVNQCLIAGGLKMDGNKWYWKSYSDHSASWTSCPSMYTYFNNKGYTIIENPSDSQVLEGNPVLYWNSKGYWGHAAICVGKDSSGKPMVAAHNTDHDSIYWKLGYTKTCTILITGSSEWKFDVNNAPKCSSTRWIGEGSVTSGDDVKWVQYALNEANNAGLAVDGIWGTNSKNATIAFQKKYGLTADGQAGTNTINKLVELLKPSIVPTGNEMSKGAGQTIADGDYWIESALSKRYLVDISGDNYDTTNGTNLKMHIWNSDTFGKYDVFTFKYLNNGFYQITQRTTNMAVDVNGASISRGANVQMYKSNNSTAQQWSITKTSDGYKLQAKCSGFCLDVSGGNVENNSNLNVWEDNGTKAQRFNFIPYKCTHNFGSWATSKSATCTADGTQTRKCSECGYSESKTIAKIGHSLSSWEITSNPTCTKTGTRQRDCSKCSYGEGESIPALGHSYGNWTNSVKTSCTVDGKDTRKCSRCGNTETRVVTKTGHKYVDKVVAPTCTEKGYTLHTCSLCNDNYKDKETNIPGHTFTSKMISGYMTYVCSDCGYMYTAPFEGEGTAESPFIISNADELRAVSETVNNTELNQIFGHAYYKQTTDIDLENISWIPIGLGYDGDNGTGEYNCNTRMFFGVYDGNQHTIYNLNSGKYTATGFLGCVRGENAEVKNLVVFGNINSNCDSGGITGGLHYGAKITNCAFIGNVNGTAAKGSVGGIAGYTNGGATISNCYHNGEITGGNETAGIVGNVAFNKWADNNAATVVENCYHVNSNVSGVKSGAIVGNCTYYEEKNNTITIKNCYASKSSNYGERNEAATYDDTMLLPDSMLKKIAEDLGEAYIDNTNSELNNGFPVFPWQLDIMLKGDADNNGVVDVNDAIMLRDWLHGSGELTNWENVDLCKDGRIDIFDLCLLKRLLIENAG